MKKRPKFKKSSEVLSELSQQMKSGSITLGELLEKLENRAFGVGLLVFSLPSALPFSIIPGISIIFSVPICIFAIQMIIANKKLWLPKILAQREIPQNKLKKILDYAIPRLKKIEHFLKPRLPFIFSRVFESIIGLIIFIMALLLMLPIPFSNFIYSMVLIIFSLGLAQKDGIAIIIGFISALIALGIIPLLLSLIKHFF